MNLLHAFDGNDFLVAAGLLLVVIGIGLVCLPAALVAAGLGLIAFGTLGAAQKGGEHARKTV